MRTLDELLEAWLSSALEEQARWTSWPSRLEQNLDPLLLFLWNVGSKRRSVFASVAANSKRTTVGDRRVLNSK